jgi:hypothetical protein
MYIETLIILIIGILILIINYLLFSKMAECPRVKVKYIYVPRTEEEAIQSQVPQENLQDLFSQIFDKPSPWVDRINNRRSGLNEDNINLYYISQS